MIHGGTKADLKTVPLVPMTFTRSLLLAAANNMWLRERATRAPFIRRSVSRFMPGEHLDAALEAAARLQVQGITTMLTRLGENVTQPEEAEAVTAHYLDVLDRARAARLDAQISVKPTQLGLDLDREICFRHLERLVDRAGSNGNFVWIDMESSRYVDPTIELFRRLRQRSADVGLALQAYLYRTDEDVRALLPLGAAIRLVKGAYLEPAAIACSKKADVDEHYFTLACRVFDEAGRAEGARLQVATHDRRLIDRLGAFITEHHIAATSYEFAMLYGIERSLQQQLVASGRRLRVLISYGENWFPWYMRRLAERPSNVWFVLKGLVR